MAFLRMGLSTLSRNRILSLIYSLLSCTARMILALLMMVRVWKAAMNAIVMANDQIWKSQKLVMLLQSRMTLSVGLPLCSHFLIRRWSSSLYSYGPT